MSVKLIKELTVISRVEMANDNDVYAIDASVGIAIYSKDDSYYVNDDMALTIDDIEYCKEFDSLKSAMNYASECLIDSKLIISGYGKHSGRKFWQLPEKIKKEILNYGK